MIYRHTKPGRLLLHTVLIAGAVLFSLPFLWMVGTSMMSDREMFRPGMHFLPNAPQPRAQSPYLSDQEYPVTPQCPRIYPYPLWKEHRARVLGYFRERIEVMKIDNPDGFDQDALVTAIFTGVWQKSLEISDPKVWIGMVDKAEPWPAPWSPPRWSKRCWRNFGVACAWGTSASAPPSSSIVNWRPVLPPRTSGSLRAATSGSSPSWMTAGPALVHYDFDRDRQWQSVSRDGQPRARRPGPHPDHRHVPG